MAGPIPKPIMRGMHVQFIKRSLVETFAVSIAVGMAFKHFVMDARKKTYDEFHRTYDAEAALKRMNEAGLMQSYPEAYKGV